MTGRLLADIYAPKLGRSAWRGPYGWKQRPRHKPQADSGFWRGEGGALNLGIIRDDDFYRRNDLTLFAEEAERVRSLIRPSRLTVSFKADDFHRDGGFQADLMRALAGAVDPETVNPRLMPSPIRWDQPGADPLADFRRAMNYGLDLPRPYPNFPCSTDLVGCAHTWPDHADETGRWECTLGCGTYMQVDPGTYLYLDGGNLDFGIIRDCYGGWRTLGRTLLRPWRWRGIPYLLRHWHQRGQPINTGNDFALFKEAFNDVGR